MNTFAKLILIQRFKIVSYYSVQIEGEDSFFEQFVNKHTIENKDKLNHIMAWLKIIGNKYGAEKDNFRPESETAYTLALPPKGVDRQPSYVEYNSESDYYENVPNNLRLYCSVINRNIVVLFSGDIKTAHKAQDCDKVRPHFKMANKLTALIDKALKDKYIKLNEDISELVFDDEFELNW